MKSAKNFLVQRAKFNNREYSQQEDYFRMFDNIKGSLRYQKRLRNELITKLQQLGPFTFFFTLSAGETRWPEFLTSVLQARGCKIIGENDNILIDGSPVHDYLKTINVTELTRSETLRMVRIFDLRVKSLLKNIMMNSEAEFYAKYYSYRVEFQVISTIFKLYKNVLVALFLKK